VKGVINLCGALADTLWIQATDPVLVSVHGTADDLVSYTQDTTSVEGMLMGSGLIHIRANNVGLPNHLHPFIGAGHVPFVLPIPFLPPASQYMDSTTWIVRDFLYQHVECDSATISGVAERLAETPVLTVFPNPSNTVFNVLLDKTGETYLLELNDITGKRIASYSIGRNINRLSIPLADMGSGVFLLSLRTNEGALLEVRKVVSQ
jgi:hypothetical protein